MTKGKRRAPRWDAPENDVLARVGERTEKALEAYRANPLLIDEHANIELATAEGGYGRRQVFELVQNGADAMVALDGGRIHVAVTKETVYCANEGEPVDQQGVDSLMASHISDKRGVEIGRFGLGFKSVLGITGEPAFFSRSGSFGFDSRKSREVLSQISVEPKAFPTLRLAYLLDPEAEAAADPILQGTMEWATTVIRLPRINGKTNWLSQDLRDFPAEFLLFSPHVGTLILDDEATRLHREITQRRDGRSLRLTESGGATTTWKVFRSIHRPSREALEDAGELSRREEVPIAWAVPTSRRLGRGKFWAFFPTEYETTLSGIVNAPWKTNEDRQNLLRGAFNDELLREVARLVVDSIPELTDETDPGRYLDVLPARGREAPNWADELISEEVYQTASQLPSLPDQDGILQRPRDVHLNPDTVEAGLEAWSSYRGRPADWCHPSVNTRERYPRALRLIQAVERTPASPQAWLEALVADGQPAASIAAIAAAARVIPEAPPGLLAELRAARIVLTRSMKWVAAECEGVFLPGEYEAHGPGLEFVHNEVAADQAAVEGLSLLGVGAVDTLGEIEILLSEERFASWADADWEDFWRLSRTADSQAAARTIRSTLLGRRMQPGTHLRVHTLAGRYRPLLETLLPGPIVPADSSRDDGVAIDTEFHAEDIELLRLLGVVDSPGVLTASSTEPWFSDYHRSALDHYLDQIPGTAKRPQRGLLTVGGHEQVGPLTQLRVLSSVGKAAFTGAVLNAVRDATAWEVFHKTNIDGYPVREFPNPTLWFICQEGWLDTSLGPRPVGECVSGVLSSWKDVLPVASLSSAEADALGLPASLEELSPATWVRALGEAFRVEDDAHLGSLYGVAARFVPQPDTIHCRVGASNQSLPPSQITVVENRRQFRALTEASTPVLLVHEAALRSELIDRWGLRPAGSAVSTRPEYVPVGSEVPLIEEFPALDWALAEHDLSYKVVRCASLRIETETSVGRVSEDVEFFVEGNLLLVDEDLDAASLLDWINQTLALQLSAEEIDEVLTNRQVARHSELVAEIRAASHEADRVAKAIGASALRQGMPKSLIEAVEQVEGGDLTASGLGKLALAVYGVSVLKEFRSAQADRGLAPPTVWAGSNSAVQYVRELGFPREFAGWEQANRPPYRLVDGPSVLPALHDYQRLIADGIKGLLGRTEDRRALLALPTGAGKTRIAVQALVEAIRNGSVDGPVLWVAQTSELCEQAVESWAEVWRAIGPERQLMISRLWGSNEAAHFAEGTQVAIATIDKLGWCVGNPGYHWLREASCLVIDEAHGSTEPSYTKVLDWLGLGRGRGDERCALVGLTATPFRGASEDETQRLVARYGRRRLDKDALGEVTYPDLQDMGVLARVDHQVIEGAEISLTVEELGHLERTRLFPGTVLNKVGMNLERNLTLLRSIQALPDDWPVLLFAASVDHARTMAALLASQGISAGSVSAETEPGARRHYVDRFRSGDLRVLTNYQVLTQGFDAPSVRALYIARPTYSPNLYQQMVGRGLRGPVNGGKGRCLIVNVADNVDQYGERLAFTEFEYLWSQR